MKKKHFDLNRREFLRRVAYGTALLQGGSLLTGFRPTNYNEDEGLYDCVVLGAGAAGITAAHYLQSDGRLRVKVLEGSSRIGGRVHTTRNEFGDMVEAGAEYVHVPDGMAPIWNDIRRFSLPTIEFDKIAGSQVYHSQFDKQVSTIRAAWEMGILKSAFMYSKIDSYSGEDISVEEFLKEISSSDFERELRQMSMLGHVPGPANEVSVRGFASDKYSTFLPIRKENYIQSGYISLFNNLAKGLDIEVNQVVERIKYSQSGVDIFVSGNPDPIRAKTALCTFSVGMLKSGKVDFFPHLPRIKREALKALDVGHHSKVALSFKERFWPEDLRMLHFLDDSIQTKRNGRNVGQTYFHGYFWREKGPYRLNALIMGDAAKRIRHMDDREVIDAICADLDRMFPSAAPTKQHLIGHTRVQWMDDPFALGGNSYIRCQKDGNLDPEGVRDILASPLDTPNLFWAGEATAGWQGGHPGSVHGAHASGIRAALEILKSLRLG